MTIACSISEPKIQNIIEFGTAGLVDKDFEVCCPIPPHTPHAISVSLPKWQDNVDYEEGNPRVVSKMRSGYPRFCVHESVKKLCDNILAKNGFSLGYVCFGFPSRRVAEDCVEFLKRHATTEDKISSLGNIKLAYYTIRPHNSENVNGANSSQLNVVIVPQILGAEIKAFWQHSGEIITSRYAEHCLKSMLPSDDFINNTKNLRYSKNGAKSNFDSEKEHEVYFEERYGRNLGLNMVAQAKLAMRCRISAGLQLGGSADMGIVQEGQASQKGLSFKDVYLYPSGMSAIYNAHRLAMKVGGPKKSVCFGFPYTDTLKILQKFGPGCHFLGLGEEEDLKRLEQLIVQEPILALFCEFPSNPLLKSPDLTHIRKLADKYGFLIVVDETIGSLVNLNVLEVADITVTSLTKIFSGDSNVMGGSLALSSYGPRYQELKECLDTFYEDLLWCEDAIFLERNSRTFEERVQKINQDAEALCDFLKCNALVKTIHYPKYGSTKDHFLTFQRQNGGFGGLFSIEFHNPNHAIPFYDNLSCAKGPSLGTNFTLACPYTLLAHYTELEWAAEFGVNSNLVRVSVGLEGLDWLLIAFTKAIEAIEIK